MHIDAVIFDHDGTLVDSETITLTLLAEMAVEAGAEVYQDDIDRFKGADIKVVFAEIERRRRAPLPVDFLDTFRSRSEERNAKHLLEYHGREYRYSLLKPKVLL